MARKTISTIGLALAAALLMSAPAVAQFGSIFGGDQAPRPPADVPQQPRYYPNPRYQQPDRGTYPEGRAYPPPSRWHNPDDPDYSNDRDDPGYRNDPDYPDRPNPRTRQSRDEPPTQPMPAPMSLPPSARPGGGTIQSQPLAPPSGAAPSQQANRPPVQSPPAASPKGPTQEQGAPPAKGVQQPEAKPPEGEQQPATLNPPTREVVVQPPPQRITNPTAVFEGLDKITGRITSFDVAINETVQFGALQVTPKACFSRPATETPQTDAFVDVDEVTLRGDIKRIFTGWMFKASPGLHAVEHPIYDVWLIDCKGGKGPAMAEASTPPDSPSPNSQTAAPKPDKPAARNPPVRARRPSARGTLPAIR